MELSRLKRLVGDGRFFHVKFRKRTDGTIRTMNARVMPPDPGGEPHYDPDEHELLTVLEVPKGQWRNIPADGIIELRAHGQRIA